MIDRYSYPFFMIFDVESIGLHGEGFAVAFVVVNAEGQLFDQNVFACQPSDAKGEESDREWVAENVPSIPAKFDCPADVRSEFWLCWQHWRHRGAALVSDCGWPVEGRFLAACIDDSPHRKWEGPYPLLDLATALLIKGIDPLSDRPRLPDELPKHDPLADCRQTARLFIENIR